MTDQQRVVEMEYYGVPFIVLLGSALHFTFDWSGQALPVALIAAVNESVWEHLKLAFWPTLFWGVIVQAARRPDAKTYWTAKALGLLVAPALIVVVFYSYTGVLGRNVLAADIGTFILSIAVGQWVTARLIVVASRLNWTPAIARALLMVQLAGFSAFTYFPPPFALFEDSRTGLRGIPDLPPEVSAH